MDPFEVIDDGVIAQTLWAAEHLGPFFAAFATAVLVCWWRRSPKPGLTKGSLRHGPSRRPWR